MNFFLHNNGSVDPDKWSPKEYEHVQHLNQGDLIAWRYAAWRVHEIRPSQDVDLTDKQQQRLETELARLPENRRDLARHDPKRRPYHAVLRHHQGPVIIKPGEEPAFKRLHDGTQEINLTAWPRHTWQRLPDPYPVCSCHGHPWPCQTHDHTVYAAHQAQKMDRLIATTQPGVCAACLEPITQKQKTITFPEESRLVPGAPGPTYHAGRRACWHAAEKYEREGRLADNPDITRIASCPGIRFIHESRHLPAAQRVDCTAGPACTGRHGPAGYGHEAPCWYQISLAAAEGAYARPTFDCGYRADRPCLGSDMSGGGTTLSPIAADLIWQAGHRRQKAEP